MNFVVIIILLSFGFYVYYKIEYFRVNDRNEKKWLSAKSSIALGIFVGFFGLNRLILSQSPVSLIVGIVFLLVGFVSAWTGFKAYQFYSSHVYKREWKRKGS
ncbi:YtpI family protein [Fervidibacillus albus]|uniref:YtpI family protein n=1 Tax=Fervidibacillus albus TaxID=2980026 RepID=A0A9E8LVN1_9BACI|nr:YtpI family protein [Fervidibacillus albus]WAA10160.1 YtpI family protein [Fervidibacillus albus]